MSELVKPVSEPRILMEEELKDWFEDDRVLAPMVSNYRIRRLIGSNRSLLSEIQQLRGIIDQQHVLLDNYENQLDGGN